MFQNLVAVRCCLIHKRVQVVSIYVIVDIIYSIILTLKLLKIVCSDIKAKGQAFAIISRKLTTDIFVFQLLGFWILNK